MLNFWAFWVPLLLASGLLPAEVDNPEYKDWSGFTPKSWVKYEQLRSQGGHLAKVSEWTVSLVEIFPDKLTLDHGTPKVPGGQAGKRIVPAKVPAREDLAPAAGDPNRGEEDLEINGVKVKCGWTETTSALQGGGRAVSRVWRSAQIPGGIAKMTTKMTGEFASDDVIRVTEWRVEAVATRSER